MLNLSCRVQVTNPNSKKPVFERIFELPSTVQLDCESIIRALRIMFGEFVTVSFDVYGKL